MRNFLLVCLMAATAIKSHAQTGELEAHWEIAIPVSYSVSERWKMNTTVTSRTGFYRQVQEADNVEWFVNFLEATQYATYRASHKISLTAGYRYRSVNPTEAAGEREHRLIQQLGIVHLRAPTRIASRLQIEQRFRTDDFAHRIRYRVSGDRPLQGEKLDVGEFYGIVSNELVTQFGKEVNTTMENRISVGFGNKWGQTSKIQLEGQIRSFDVLDNPRNTFFLMTGFYFNLD
ncbi:MAG: DUF2490 domain-containing protein [Bacteroidota bacterium]